MNETTPRTGCADQVGFFFLFGFGAVFAAVGIISLLVGLDGGDGLAVVLVVGGVFSVVGLGIMIAALRMRGTMARRHALVAAEPERPWLWRPDWASGEIVSSQGGLALVLWIFALFWNAISWTVAPLALADSEADPVVWIVILFPLIGLLLLGLAIGSSLRARRFGRNVLILETRPGVIGGELVGRIVSARPVEIESDLSLRLACLNVVTTSNGKNSSTTEHLLWESNRTIGPEAVVQNAAGGSEIPVRFVIPWGQRASDPNRGNNRIVWRVEARADLVGADYDHRFEVPVFVTEDSDRTLTEAAPQAIDLAEAERRGSPGPRSRIGLRRLADGAIELDFPAGRNPAVVAVLGVMALIWAGVCFALSKSDAPIIFPIVFSLFEALILLGFFHLLVAAALIHVRRDGIGYEKRVLGMVRRGWHARPEIRDLAVDVGAQSGNRAYHRLRLELVDGRRITLGDGIPDRDEARALEATIREILGLGDDQPVRG